MCGQNECGHGSCSTGHGNECNCSGSNSPSNECGSSCECSSGNSCGDGSSCSYEGNCEDEDWAAAKAYKYYYKAKKKLIIMKVKERLEKKYGKKLDSLADAIVSYVEEQNAAEEKGDKKTEELREKFDDVFGD